MYWIVLGIITVILLATYIALILWTRRRQKKFDEQYNAAKERHEVFVLNKKITKERPRTGRMKFIKVKTYHVVGRVNMSQAVKGITMARMQTVTFQTTKDEFKKIQLNHRYKMDIAGNYIGNVVAPPPPKGKAGKAEAKSGSGKAGAAKTGATSAGTKRGWFGRKNEPGTKGGKAAKQNKNAK